MLSERNRSQSSNSRRALGLSSLFLRLPNHIDPAPLKKYNVPVCFPLALREEEAKEVLTLTRTDDCTESPTVPIPRRDRMTRMMQQHTCTLILGLTALVGFTLVGSYAGAVSHLERLRRCGREGQ